MKSSPKVSGKQQIQKKLFLEQLAKTPIVSLVSEKTGIPRSNYYRWIKEDSEFGLQAHEIYKEGVSGLNDMATSQLLKLIKEGDRHAIVFWLRMRDPEFGGIITRNKEDEEAVRLSEKRKEMEAEFHLSEVFIKYSKKIGLNKENGEDSERCI